MKKVCLLFFIVIAIPAHATWTTVQSPSLHGCSSGTSCLQTVTSTGSGHLLTVTALSDGASDSISACCNAGCTSSWVRGPHQNTGTHTQEIWYCLNSASGATSIGPTTWADTTTHETAVKEFSSSLGTMALDTGSTPTCTATFSSQSNPTNCSLTVSSNNDIYVIGLSTSSSASACSQSYTCTFASGDGEGYKINQTSYTASQWTMTSGTGGDVGAAFQETSTASPAQVGAFIPGP